MAPHGGKGDGDEVERPRVRSRAARVVPEDQSEAPMNDSSAATTDSTAPKTDGAAAAAAPPPQELIRLGVNLKEFELSLDDEVLEKLNDDITDAILSSFEERGIK